MYTGGSPLERSPLAQTPLAQILRNTTFFQARKIVLGRDPLYVDSTLHKYVKQPLLFLHDSNKVEIVSEDR